MRESYTEESLAWYAIHTHPKQEDRAAGNLQTFGIEVFLPKLETQRYNPYSNKPTLLVKPLFPNYLFGRFKTNDLLHKARFARGVHSVVSTGNTPSPIADQVIDLIKSRQGMNGLIKLDDELKAGDEVVIKWGSFQGLKGIFDRRLKGTDRVIILLEAITYQHQVMIPREGIEKAPQAGRI